MKRLLLGLTAALALTTAARAHFVWILPGSDASKPTVQVVFSDSLSPDDPKYLERIKQTELSAFDKDGKATPVKLTMGKEALEAELPAGTVAVAGTCRYGVTERGGSDPFLLVYHAKTLFVEKGDNFGESIKKALEARHDKMRLEIVNAEGSDGARVIFDGKGVPEAEVVLIGDGGSVTLKADKDGDFKPSDDEIQKIGLKELAGARAKHVEKKEGELDGKKYKEVRHYSTLTVRMPAGGCDAPAKEEKLKEDPSASRLLAAARAARAQWAGFPGLTADVEVNLDGKVSKGAVEIDKSGKVTVNVPDEAAASWAKGQLSQTASHRLDDSASLKTACVFDDEDKVHPLGRAIKVIDDEFHSSYRVRDRQIIVVNRNMKDSRFTITVMHNYVNPEGKFIPATYVVNTWSLKDETLRSSQTHHHTWKRVGAFDLPESLTLVTASGGKQEARGLKLSNIELKK